MYWIVCKYTNRYVFDEMRNGGEQVRSGCETGTVTYVQRSIVLLN